MSLFLLLKSVYIPFYLLDVGVECGADIQEDLPIVASALTRLFEGLLACLENHFEFGINLRLI